MSISGKARQGAMPITNLDSPTLIYRGRVCQRQDGGHSGRAIVGIYVSHI